MALRYPLICLNGACHTEQGYQKSEKAVLTLHNCAKSFSSMLLFPLPYYYKHLPISGQPQGSVLALKLEEVYRERAKKNMALRKGGQPGASCTTWDNLETIDTLGELKDIAKVGSDTP